ncbi:MAG: FAD-dependent oxidoreductase [Oscillospiraceae bacterium]|nr:FAD-dependent oxidoreductase [Oscillospiraceae bacterium]
MELNVRPCETVYDVIVAGGGPAGCAAAIAAARQGAKTLLLEAGGALGGMATLGMVSKWMPFDDREKIIYKSLPLEIITRYKKLVGLEDSKSRSTTIYPEALKRLYDEMLAEAGAEVLFGSTVAAAQVVGGRIEALIAANKAGLTAYRAKVFIDCTGDGDVAAMSGVPMEYGDEAHYVQEASLCFAISNIHTDKVTRKLSSNPDDGVWPEILASGKYPRLVRHFIPATLRDGTIVVNAGGIPNVNATDPREVSEALREGRRIAEDYLAALKEYQPEAFRDALLVETAPSLGVRESRRIVGEYVLTADDYFARRSFPDEICRNSYWLDCHLPEGKENPCEIGGKWYRYEPGESHGIPWRGLVPKNVGNLLVAGRCISVDHMVFASVRVMPNCLATGEAAGVGASIAAKQSIDVHAIDARDVIAKLQ